MGQSIGLVYDSGQYMPRRRRKVMRHGKLLLVLSMCGVAFLPAFASQFSSEVRQIAISAPSLKNSLYRIAPEQPIAVYLPPSYLSGARRYPVVYFLPGFAD
jgi:hypothetical protein